jgi:hypothetical protein
MDTLLAFNGPIDSDANVSSRAHRYRKLATAGGGKRLCAAREYDYLLRPPCSVQCIEHLFDTVFVNASTHCRQPRLPNHFFLVTEFLERLANLHCERFALALPIS